MQSPLVEPWNKSTPHFSTHHQAIYSHQQSDKILFEDFVIALNAAFDQQLSLADEGYESGSDTVDLTTPLRKTPQIHHVSGMEHVSFDPAPVTPCNMPQTPPRPVHRCLSFSTPKHSEDEEK